MFNRRKSAQQTRRAREKLFKGSSGFLGSIFYYSARLAIMIFFAPLAIPFHAFLRSEITIGWKRFYQVVHLLMYLYLLVGYAFFNEWIEDGSIYVIGWSLLMIILTLLLMFKLKKKTSITNKGEALERIEKAKMTADIDEVKEGYFIANVNVPKGLTVPESSIESIKQQVKEAMEAEGEEVLDVTVKLSNVKKRSRTITQAVKDRVWNRDGGKCVQCGSNENLEFDHIIPFSKGGANTYRNIQLLCEPCNRSKSAKIG